MRDPTTWSFPIGRLFGITVRVHIFLPIVALGLILRASTQGVSLGEACLVMLLLFFSVLLHEFGHCFAARAVDGDASEMLLWPLGGLAFCDLPHTPRAHLVCSVGGPAVNALLALLAGSALAFATLVPPFNPFESPYQPRLWNWREGAYHVTAAPPPVEREPAAAAVKAEHPEVRLAPAARAAAAPSLALWQSLAAQMFWLNWVLLLLNLLPAYPLDGGRILQSLLWWQTGDYRTALSTASYAGFVVMLGIGVYAIVADSVLGLLLALIIYDSCKRQLIMLETGGEETAFGYDFSQGYTSLEGPQPQAPPRRRQPNALQRFFQRRAAQRARRDLERREAEDRRMDELLDKVQNYGLESLTEEERRFMARVSARYRR